MGSCISKCRPKTTSEDIDEWENVQDKLMISQAPESPICVLNIKPPSRSASSFSSFSCTTSTASSCSSASPSSVLSSKIDRSFSNEFLWSCLKENPHVISRDPIKESPVKSSVSSKFHAPKSVSHVKLSPVVAPAKQLTPPQRVLVSTPQKRVRATSPVLVRQKNFKRDQSERPNSAYSIPSRTLKSSPFPSRRFEGDKCRVMLAGAPQESVFKRSPSPKRNAVISTPSSVRNKGSGNLRLLSPNYNSRRHRRCSRNGEMESHLNLGSQTGEIAVGEVLSNLGIDSLPIEDIDNPLISLDCFIFL